MMFVQPRSLTEALAALEAHPAAAVLAGGTDIYPADAARAGWGHRRQSPIVDISRIDGMSGIEDRGNHWWIGALTTWSDIADAALPPLFDGLRAAAREIGGIQIQNRGTIGGNICTASPAGDSLPCLMALDVEVAIAGPGGDQLLPIAAFLTGYRRTAVSDRAAIVTGIRVPKAAGHGAFLKFGTRRYLVISIAMVAGAFELTAGGLIARARIAIGACSPVALRLRELERDLVGQRPAGDVVRRDHLAALAPIDDVRASAAFRRVAAQQLVCDLLDGVGRAAAEGRSA